MYEELVKRIRGCSYSDPNGCEECRDCPNTENYYECKQKLALQAADAIEELGRVADAIPHVCECCIGCEVETGGCDRAFALSPKRAREYLSKPRWIPVTERLPKDLKDVQITVFWHGAWRTMYGYYDGSFWHLYAPMHTEVADVEVVGWMEKPAPMPLPEPPKE